MKHVIRKAYFDFEKEENFLNEMSEKGFALINYTWCKYVFEDAPKGEYIYRLELLEHPVNSRESEEYIRFMKETGAELVATFSQWAYFRKKAADGEFNIYSNLDSKIKHYKRIIGLCSILLALNLFIGLYNMFTGIQAQATGYPPVNIYISIISFVIAVLLLYVIFPLNKKVTTLEKEKLIRE